MNLRWKPYNLTFLGALRAQAPTMSERDDAGCGLLKGMPSCVDDLAQPRKTPAQCLRGGASGLREPLGQQARPWITLEPLLYIGHNVSWGTSSELSSWGLHRFCGRGGSRCIACKFLTKAFGSPAFTQLQYLTLSRTDSSAHFMSTTRVAREEEGEQRRTHTISEEVLCSCE